MRTQSKATDQYKSRVTQINKEIATFNSEINQADIKIDSLMTVRHQVLVNARLNDIEIPLQQEKIWKIFENFTITTDFKSIKLGKSEYDKRRSNGYI